MLVFFTLGSGRSGTGFAAALFGRNVLGCVAFHEPEPVLYGNAVRFHEQGREDQVELLFRPKLANIAALEQAGVRVYFEANHLFLKSFADIAIRHLPQLRLVHLVRSPLEVARSHMNRPWRVDGANPYAISPNHPIFRVGFRLTEYQKFLLQWIEMERRAVAFVDRHGLAERRYVLATPRDLNDRARLKAMFDHFGLDVRGREVDIACPRNANAKKTVVTDAEVTQLREVVDALPDGFLRDVFTRDDTYTSLDLPWLDYLTA